VDKKFKIAFFFLLIFGFFAIGGLLLFSSDIAILNPKGQIGIEQRDLLTLSTLIMLIVVIPTLLLTFYIAWRYWEGHKHNLYNPNWNHSHLAEAIWWGIPFAITIALGTITWFSCHKLDPFRPLISDVRPLKIQVVALQWKWLFIYPEERIATVNYLQIPEKRPINFEITADAPMNSFWIPELGGQVYAMAGMRSKLHLIANQIGSYRGSSANFSGAGFSGMTFVVEATTEQAFDSWVWQTRSSPTLAYATLLEKSSYNPPASYTLVNTNLFNDIMMKYMQ
jgi:cytochrome o ubiquinol oxidase subunit II